MKIISKHKDYYDYLKGVYGVDEKLILDRTKYYNIPYIPGENCKEILHIGELVIEGLWKNNQLLFGSDLNKYAVEDKNFHGVYHSYSNLYPNTTFKDYYYIPDGKHSFKNILKKPLMLEDSSPTWKENCPILRYTHEGYKHFPILSEYGVGKILSAEKIWQELSQWLSKQITKNEPVVPVGDDATRIKSAGFDIKTSFKNIKK